MNGRDSALLAYALVMRTTGDRRYTDEEWTRLHLLAKTVPCSWCGVPARMTCRVGTGRTMTVEPAHPSRIATAREHAAERIRERGEHRDTPERV